MDSSKERKGERKMWTWKKCFLAANCKPQNRLVQEVICNHLTMGAEEDDTRTRMELQWVEIFMLVPPHKATTRGHNHIGC